MVLSLASQAAVSLENNILYQEIETLFEGFVKASVQAIESRDPTTSRSFQQGCRVHGGPGEGGGQGRRRSVRGHSISPPSTSRRSATRASCTTSARSASASTCWSRRRSSTRPRLENSCSCASTTSRRRCSTGMMKERFEASLQAGRYDSGAEGRHRPGGRRSTWRRSKVPAEDHDSQRAAGARRGARADPATRSGRQDLRGPDGKVDPLPHEDEYDKLRIPKGSLDDKEREEIESHVTHTYEFLSTIPWTKEMRNIPDHRLGSPREAGRRRVPARHSVGRDSRPDADDDGVGHLRRPDGERPPLQAGGLLPEGPRHPRCRGEGREAGRRTW